MRSAALAAVLLLVAAPSRAADAKASPASIAKLQKLASRVRGLKKGLTVVPKSKVASKGKASKPAALPSNKISRVTALRSLYRQMAALDYRACKVANLPKVSQLKAKAGLRRLAMMGERAGLDDADLDDPDSDADLSQQCGACPSGTAAAGDDVYGLCYCADPADLAAADAAVSSNTADVDASSAAVASVSTSTVVAGSLPDMDTTIARLFRFEKIANKNLSEKATPKALPHAKIPAVAEWHYQRAQIYEGMAAAATKPAFGPARLGKDGKPQLAGVATSSQLRKLAARLSSGRGPVVFSRPLAKGGYSAAIMPRSIAVRNTYATMAAADLRAARIAGLPDVQADAAKLMADSLVNLMAGGRISRKPARKSAKKADRKAGARIADDEGDGGDSGGGEVNLSVEPVAYVDTSGGGDSGGSAAADSGSSDYGASEQPAYIDPGSSDSGGDSGSMAASEDPGFGDVGSGDSGALADSGDSGSSADNTSDPNAAAAFQGADDNSVAADNSGAAADSGSADNTGGSDNSSVAATPDNSGVAWGAADLAGSNENAVNDSFNGTPLTDPGTQDAAPGASNWADLTGSEENAVAANGAANQATADGDANQATADGDSNQATADGDSNQTTADGTAADAVGPDQLQDSPADSAATPPNQAPDNADAVAAAGQDNGGPVTEPLDPNVQRSCSENGGGGFQRKAGVRKGDFIQDCKTVWHGLTDGTVCQMIGACDPPPPVLVPRTPTPPPVTPTPPATQTMTDLENQGYFCKGTNAGIAHCTNMQTGDQVDAPMTGPGPAVQPGVTPSTTTKNRRVATRVARMDVACPAKSQKVYARKSGMTVCSLPTKAGKVAGRKAGKPLYSRLARLNTAALKVSHGLADRQTPRAKKAMLLYQRGQIYARMALAIAAPPRARRASKPHADKVASKAPAKSAAKPAKPVVSDDVSTPAPEQSAPAPQPAPAAPSAEDVMKQDMKDMDDMGKDMENQIRQRSGH